MQATQELIIDPEFAAMCRALQGEELSLLEQDIIEHGCLDSIIIWEGHDIVLDGHNRYRICTEHDIEFLTREIALADREACLEWIDKHQLGKRNLTDAERQLYRGRLYSRRKKNVGERGSGKKLGQNEPASTAEAVAKELGVSATTIKRDAKFAEADDEIGKNVGTEARTEILSGKSPLSKEKVMSLAGKTPEEQAAVIAIAKQPPAKAIPPVPSIIDEKLTKSEQESQVVRDEFAANLDKVSDGGVYTIETLADAVCIVKTSVHWFIRMCEVAPSVKVIRTYGRKGLTQYSFVKTNCVDGQTRIRQLAEQIATDAATSSKSCAAAQKILQLLGG